MSTITVKRELPATRCDICHQADCFTPETGVCTRCVGIQILGKSEPVIHPSPVFETLSGYQRSKSRMQDWLSWVVGGLPVLFLVVGWLAENDDKTMLWWKIAYGLSLLWLIFSIIFSFFRKGKEVEAEGVGGLLLLINTVIGGTPIVLMFLFFFIMFSNRHC